MPMLTSIDSAGFNSKKNQTLCRNILQNVDLIPSLFILFSLALNLGGRVKGRAGGK